MELWCGVGRINGVGGDNVLANLTTEQKDQDYKQIDKTQGKGIVWKNNNFFSHWNKKLELVLVEYHNDPKFSDR